VGAASGDFGLLLTEVFLVSFFTTPPTGLSPAVASSHEGSLRGLELVTPSLLVPSPLVFPWAAVTASS